MTDTQIENTLENTKELSNVKYYSLCNNYGWTFEKNGKKYDVRHWLNCYGVELNEYTLGNKRFDTIEELKERLNNL